MNPTIVGIGSTTKTLLTAYTLAATILLTTTMSSTLYAEALTPFLAPQAEYILPLTTDADEVLLDDSGDFYLTWE